MLGSCHTKCLVLSHMSSLSWLVPQLHVPALREGRWVSSSSVTCVLNRLSLLLNLSGLSLMLRLSQSSDGPDLLKQSNLK